MMYSLVFRSSGIGVNNASGRAVRLSQLEAMPNNIGPIDLSV